MRLFWLMMSLLVPVLVVGAQIVPEPIICPDSLPSRLIPGEMARVTPGDANRVRRLPSTGAEVVGSIPGGQTFTAISGPACVDGFAWWYVAYGDLFGWTVEGGDEYWLEPATDAELPPVPEVAYSYVQSNGIQGYFTVAQNATMSLEPADIAGGRAPYADIHLLGYTGTQSRGEFGAYFRVYEVESYETITGRSLDPLREVVETTRSTETFSYELDSVPEGVVPQIINAALVFATRIKAECFNGSCGLFYLAHFSQSINLVTDGQLTFVYTGLTHDEQYYIEAVFFLDSPLLPPQDLFFSPGFDVGTFANTYYLDYVEALPLLFAEESIPTQPAFYDLVSTASSITIDPDSARIDVAPLPVDYEGVSFELPSVVAPSVTSAVVPAKPDPSFSWEQSPQLVHIRPDGYDEWFGVFVYSAADYDAMFDGALSPLRETLDNPPAEPTAPAGPRYNAGRVLTAQVAYLDFVNGSGVRYLGYWTQSYNRVTPSDLSYVYAGMTDDRAYYVLVVLPVRNNFLQMDSRLTEYLDMNQDDFIDNYRVYMEAVGQVVDKSSALAFMPSLNTLDTLVQSLAVEASVLLEPGD